MTSYETIYKMCVALWDSENEDCKRAESYGLKESICRFFAECYDYESMCRWLADHDMRIAYEFKAAEIASKEEEGYTGEDWVDFCCDNALIWNDDYAVIRW